MNETNLASINAILSDLIKKSFHQIDHSTVWWTVVGVNWSMLCQECSRAVLYDFIVPSAHLDFFQNEAHSEE